MKKIALIGSTGSIGRQTLSVVRKNPDKFEIVSLAAGNNVGEFLAQVSEFKPKVATIGATENLKDKLPLETEFFCGEDAYLNAIVSDADVVVVALVGFKGIIAVLDAIEKGKDIALATKESLVVGGELVIQKAREKGVKITPIDSEHSAIWQALGFDFDTPFNKLILTCSGGAFRDMSEEQLKTVTAADALKHPNWNMGAKITVDCATLVNKAFEVIEAKWLYNTSFDKIDVIIHRQSIIHSMVEFVDGAVMAQLSYPTMELPICLALNYPERISVGLKSLDFASLRSLTFEEIDHKRFPCFNLVLQAAKEGGLFPAVANGANEEAVKLFLENRIGYGDIYKSIYGALQSFDGGHHVHIEELTEADAFARKYVRDLNGV
ncbi:MAG: 1-deoxy-D-xylulose-5-phosphate reductoisomerase [Clostridiales bacterium]|nr:1-deoxy-D-xylulose-5-phosphate reductoisomerase [Clostridiales bacterium]